MAHTHSIISYRCTTQKSFLRNILVSMVYTSMYRYVLSTYQYIPVNSMYFMWGRVDYINGKYHQILILHAQYHLPQPKVK
jgi:hypothetical protein